MPPITSNETYTLLEIVRLSWLGKSATTVARKILEDLHDQNLLQAEVTGTGTARRYKVKGENLIKYLESKGI